MGSGEVREYRRISRTDLEDALAGENSLDEQIYNPPVTELAKIFWVERWGAGQSGVSLLPVVGLCQPLRVQWSVRWS